MIYILAVSSIFSPIRSLSVFNEIWAGCLIIWFACTLMDIGGFKSKPSRYVFCVYFYIIYTVTIAYVSGNAAIGNRFFELSQLPVFYLAYRKNILLGKATYNNTLLLMASPFVLITCILTLNAYRVNPIISRAIAKKTDVGFEYMKQGVGGYEFIYFLVFIVAILMYVFFRNFDRVSLRNRLLGIGILIAFSVNIALSNFSTALLLLCICIFFRMFFYRVNIKYIFIIILGGFLFIPIASYLLLNFLDVLSQVMGESLNSSRIVEIEQFLLNDTSGSSLSARNDAFGVSINAFLQHPLLGVITSTLSYQGGYLVGFGQHSQILDTFALYGGGIGLLQIYIYTKPIILRLKSGDNFVSGLSLTILVLLCTLLTINNATPSIGFAVFFVFPTAHDWLQRKSKMAVSGKNKNLYTIKRML